MNLPWAPRNLFSHRHGLAVCLLSKMYRLCDYIMTGVRARVFMPMCRMYAKRFIKDKPADWILSTLTALHFWYIHGYPAHLKRPRSFEAKITARMLYDRNPLWTTLSDKLLVREFVAARIGSDYLVPLLWSGTDPAHIPYDRLPSSFVLKANHGCKYNIIVTRKSRLAIDATNLQLQKWLLQNFCMDKFLGTAWAYRNIKPSILVESFLDENGNAPVDYKFFCFAGRAEYLQMNFNRFGNQSEKFFDRDFMPLDLWQGTPTHLEPVARPANYTELVNLADTLSRGFDFIRVDLYSVSGRAYFGELTCYPSAGCDPLKPKSYDFLWGEKWKVAPYVSPLPTVMTERI
jgi:hypothetical protein